MKIIYIISIVIMLVLFMLIKKNDKKENVLGMLGLGVVLLFSYNVIECYILNFFNIKLDFLNLSIANILIDVVGLIYIIKKREIQSYICDSKDLIYIFLIRYICFISNC